MRAWNLPCQQVVHTPYGEFCLSKHSMQQFYKKFLKLHPDLSQEKKDSIEYIYGQFLHHFENAELCERRNDLRCMLEHNLVKARYYVSNQWVFVVHDDQWIVITCFPYEATKELYRKKINRQPFAIRE
jgi:hypothetical protein